MYTNSAAVIGSFTYGMDLSPLISQGVNIPNLLDNSIIPMAEAELNRMMGQTLEQETLSGVRLDGAGTWDIALPHFPIQTLTKMTVNFGFQRLIYQFQNIRHTASRLLPAPFNVGDEDNPNLPPNTCDVFVDRDSGVCHVDLTGSLLSLASMPGTYPVWNITFTAGQRDIICYYTHGFPAANLPVDIVTACGMLAAIYLGEMAAQRITGGADSIAIGQVRKSWKASKLGAIFDLWMNFIEDTVTVYKIKPLGN